jgi:hypothetical protein
MRQAGEDQHHQRDIKTENKNPGELHVMVYPWFISPAARPPKQNPVKAVLSCLATE